MSTTPVRRRTPAAARFTWPAHDVCDVALPMHLVGGSLTVLDGDPVAVEALLQRIDHMNDDREVLTPAPLSVRRHEGITESVAAVNAALEQGYPVVCQGQPQAAVAAGEPVPDLTLTLVTTQLEEVVEPVLSGNMHEGFHAVITGESSGDHLLHLFQAWTQASLAGLTIAQRR